MTNAKRAKQTRSRAGFLAPSAVVTTLLSVLAALAAWRLPTFVEGRVAHELAAMGFPEARFTVGDVGWDHVTLRDVALASDLSIGEIEVGYHDPLALASGRVGVVTIEDARWITARDALASGTAARFLAPHPGGGVGPERIRIVDGRVEMPELTVVVDGDVSPASGAYALTLRTCDDTATLDLSGDAHDARWRFDGAVPHVLVSRVPAIAVDGPVRARIEGHAHRAEAWSVDATGEIETDDARVPTLAARMRGATASIEATATLGDDWASTAHVRLVVDHVDVPGARVEDSELDASLRIDPSGSGIRMLADGPIAVHARELAAGPARADEVRFVNVALAIAERSDTPLLDVSPDATHLALRFRGRSSLAGLLRARTVHATGSIDVRGGPDGTTTAIPVRLASERVSLRDDDASVSGARFELPLAWDERGVFSADGALEAGVLAWHGIALGAVSGPLALRPDHVSIDWTGAATATAPFHLTAVVAGTPRIDVDVPVSDVSEGDAFQRALVATTGIDVRGHAGGSLHVEPGTDGLGSARLVLDGARVVDTSGRGAAEGTHGTIALSSLVPLASAESDRVSFTALHLGTMLTMRDGSARVRFEPTGDVAVEDAEARVAGGHLYVSPFRFTPRDPDLALELRFDGIEMERIAALLAEGSIRVTGLLDGHLAMRVHFGQSPSIVLGDGVLVARGPGRIRVTSVPATLAALDLDTLASGTWLEGRLLTALSDFEYSDLTFDIDRVGGEPCLHASVAGHGALTPQELDLTIAIEDVQLLVDQSLHFWTASPLAHT
jgi:hypothetical protein